jgi:hypothetical protein
MEPIVILGLIAVVYGGYVSIIELCGDISALLPGRAARTSTGRRERLLKLPIKKMAGMHV